MFLENLDTGALAVGAILPVAMSSFFCSNSALALSILALAMFFYCWSAL